LNLCSNILFETSQKLLIMILCAHGFSNCFLSGTSFTLNPNPFLLPDPVLNPSVRERISLNFLLGDQNNGKVFPVSTSLSLLTARKTEQAPPAKAISSGKLGHKTMQYAAGTGLFPPDMSTCL
jgi:hypothetical protein